jgi:hypothetical protein
MANKLSISCSCQVICREISGSSAMYTQVAFSCNNASPNTINNCFSPEDRRFSGNSLPDCVLTTSSFCAFIVNSFRCIKLFIIRKNVSLGSKIFSLSVISLFQSLTTLDIRSVAITAAMSIYVSPSLALVFSRAFLRISKCFSTLDEYLLESNLNCSKILFRAFFPHLCYPRLQC